MADRIYLVQGDTGPDIKVTLTREDTGLPENLSGATVKLHFRRRYTDQVLFTLTGQSTPTEAAEGVVVFAFSAPQLDVDSAYYDGEVEVVFDSGQVETIYESIEFFVRKSYA